MEQARAALLNKQTQPTSEIIHPDSTTDDADMTDLEEDQGSEFDDFILGTPKRSRKPALKFGFSGRKPPIPKSKENPCGTGKQNAKKTRKMKS